MSHWLRNNQSNGGRHTCGPIHTPNNFPNHYLAQDSARCRASRRLQQTKTSQIALDNPDIHRPGYAVTIDAGMFQAIIDHRADLNTIEAVTQILWYNH